jgi:hypothetical protein
MMLLCELKNVDFKNNSSLYIDEKDSFLNSFASFCPK